MQTTFTIGDLAREFGVTLRTLRFYEDKDLIRPRRQGASRIYRQRERARLKLILLGRRVGFPLKSIKDMLALYDLREGDQAQLRMARGRFAEQIDALKRQKRDVEQAIEELTRTLSIVNAMLSASPAARPEPALEAAE